MLLLVALACQEPFDQDRHDLVDFRIVGMQGLDGDPRAFVWSGYGAWHATAPTLDWAEIDDGWSLRAEDTEGDVETGELTLSPGATDPAVGDISRTVDGDVATLAIDVADTHATHWMAPGGTFEETGAHSTTWTAPEDGIWPIVALHFDGLGGNGWDVVDVPVGVEPPWIEVGTRIFPTDATAGGEGWWEATLTAADTLGGVILSDVSVAEEGDAFDFSALVEGRVGRDEVEGTRVRFQGTVVLP